MATEPANLQRLNCLDVLRGVAVMGILVMNINNWGLGRPGYWNAAAIGGADGLNLAVWWFDTVFAADKMRGLFSIMFGASTLLVIQRAMAKAESPARVHYSRMIALLILGYAHYALVWRSDILVLYASCGLLLFLFHKLSPRALWIWAGVFFLAALIPAALFTIPPGLAGYGLMAHPSADLLAAFNDLNLSNGPNSPQTAADLALHRSGYSELFHSRVIEHTFDRFEMLQYEGAETVSLMLIGMALFKQRMLTGEWAIGRYRRWAIVGIGTGLVANVILAVWQLRVGMNGYAVLTSQILWSMPFDFAMAIGYAALVMAWVKSGGPSWLLDRIAAVGRMAFTNYLMTSIIMTTIFYGYGLGLTGMLERAELFLVMLGMWALMVAWSKPWLDRYQYGPFEWLWRSLARTRLQPMRKSPPLDPSPAGA
ncbi:MAG: DUF418 domain-containing protein [Sphingomicrobium sp.]